MDFLLKRPVLSHGTSLGLATHAGTVLSAVDARLQSVIRNFPRLHRWCSSSFSSSPSSILKWVRKTPKKKVIAAAAALTLGDDFLLTFLQSMNQEIWPSSPAHISHGIYFCVISASCDPDRAVVHLCLTFIMLLPAGLIVSQTSLAQMNKASCHLAVSVWYKVAGDPACHSHMFGLGWFCVEVLQVLPNLGCVAWHFLNWGRPGLPWRKVVGERSTIVVGSLLSKEMAREKWGRTC